MRAREASVQQSPDEFTEQFRALDLRAALASLADQGETERGAVFTRPEVVASGGFLRFQAQYLRRIRIPRWEAISKAQRAALIAAEPTDRAAIDRATFAAYELTDDEAWTTKRCADAARVTGDHRGAARAYRLSDRRT